MEVYFGGDFFPPSISLRFQNLPPIPTFFGVGGLYPPFETLSWQITYKLFKASKLTLVPPSLDEISFKGLLLAHPFFWRKLSRGVFLF